MTLFSAAAVVVAFSTGPLLAPVLEAGAATTPNQETQAADASATAAAQSALEEAFSKKMSGAVLVGRFTIDGRDGIPQEERYEIKSVRKLRDDIWVFTARIKYGQQDVEVPLQLKVAWAGDTPVINMDNFTIPGMGTFDFRVLFHGSRYVGTWQHGKFGGHMFGRIQQAQQADEATDEAAKPASAGSTDK